MAEVELPEAKILRLQEGDALLFQAPKHLSDHEAETLVEQVQRVFPGHRALIVDGDIKVTVARIEAR